MNFFTIFDLDNIYNISTTYIEEKYIALQKQYHPDNINIENVLDTKYNINTINEAYTILKDNIKRSEYLLSLNNLSLDDFKLSNSQLISIMELNESIENAETKSILKEILSRIEKDIKILSSTLLNTWNTQDLHQSGIITASLKYMTNSKNLCKRKIIQLPL